MNFRRLPWLLLLGWALTARAHPVLQDALWLQFEPAQLRVAVNVSVKEICVAQQLAPPTPGSLPAELAAAATHHADYVRQQLTFAVGTNALAGTLVRITLPPAVADPERTFCQYELTYPWRGPPPAEVTVVNQMLAGQPDAAGMAWQVDYVVRAKRAGDGAATTWLLASRQPAVIPTGWAVSATPEPPPASRTFWEYFRHGLWHILTGFDHLLFVSALVLAARNFWEMVKVIAAFTLAHSLTLALCVFGIFRLPPAVVEPVIALSIIFVAVENWRWPERANSRLRLVVAFGFGLVHGLGFAGGLLDAMAGLPAAAAWTALGAFSLGVEAGHQVVVLPLFGLLALGRARLPVRTNAMWLRHGATAISGAGVYFLCTAVREQLFCR